LDRCVSCKGSAARHGIEARGILVRASKIHLKHLGFAESKYHFITGDVHQAIRNLKPGTFDTILCLGFFYHTAHHFALLEEFKRLDPRFLIIDSQISRGRGKHIIFGLEATDSPLAAASDKQLEWAGRMSRELIEESLKSFGFEYAYFDWENFIRNLKNPCPYIDDYAIGNRVTIHARPAVAGMASP
jgi:hypothetical protein